MPATPDPRTITERRGICDVQVRFTDATAARSWWERHIARRHGAELIALGDPS
ncbi:MAG: hypothetical protein KY450_14680 [Actinobacteria bacterium]|nr:hypothetical protein [Actinomycetota bacterium]